jgi:hypothetical protein
MRPTNEWLRGLLPPHEPPCVSIYMPTFRTKPPAWQNPIQFKDMLKKVHAELERVYPKSDARALIARIEAGIPGGEAFWEGPRAALAVFASGDLLRMIDLHQPVSPTAVVADTFHVKPLIRMLEVDQRYHVLALTMRGVRVFEGDRDGLRPLDVSNMPQSPETVSKMRLNHQVDTATDLATPDSQYPGEGTSPAPVSAERFVQAVAQAVWEQFSRDARLPLILVADEKLNALFRSANKNPYLMDEGLMLDPKGMGPRRLHKETWPVMEPRFRQEVQKLVDRFKAAEAHQRGSAELQPVARAATLGRVDTLLIDAVRQIPGRIESSDDSVSIRLADPKEPLVDDLLDDLAEMVLKADGAVLVLSPDEMPSTTGLAAIYRY